MFLITKGYVSKVQLRPVLKVPFRAYVRLIMKMMKIHAICSFRLNLMQMIKLKQIIKDVVMLIYQVSLHVIVQILIHYFHNQQIKVEITIHVSTKSSLEEVTLLVIQIQDYQCKNLEIYIQSMHWI